MKDLFEIYFPTTSFGSYFESEQQIIPIVFDNLEFHFNKKHELLWEDQGDHIPEEECFFPKVRNKKFEDKSIKKYDAWTMKVRLRHMRGHSLKKGTVISDDFKKIRVQAKKDNPGQKRSNWNLYFNYYPFQEVENDVINEGKANYRIYEDYFDNILEPMGEARHKKDLSSKIPEHIRVELRKTFLKKLVKPLPYRIAEKLFSEKAEQGFFLENLFHGSYDNIYRTVHNTETETIRGIKFKPPSIDEIKDVYSRVTQNHSIQKNIKPKKLFERLSEIKKSRDKSIDTTKEASLFSMGYYDVDMSDIRRMKTLDTLARKYFDER